MMAEDDLLFINLRDIYREEFQKRNSQSHKLKVQKNFTPSFQKLEVKNLLETPKNYLRELFGVTNCGISEIQRNFKNCFSCSVFFNLANLQPFINIELLPSPVEVFSKIIEEAKTNELIFPYIHNT